MGFGCPDCPFSCIAKMDMGQEELVPFLPGFSDEILVVRTDFIVQFLEIHLMSAACESLHDVSVQCDTVSVASHLEGGI